MLVEEAALARADEECLADADLREARPALTPYDDHLMDGWERVTAAE